MGQTMTILFFLPLNFFGKIMLIDAMKGDIVMFLFHLMNLFLLEANSTVAEAIALVMSLQHGI